MTEIQHTVKKDVNKILRKIMFPMGLTIAIVALIWMVVHSTAFTYSSTDASQKAVEVLRYFALIDMFAALALSIIMIIYSIKRLTTITADNAKSNVTPLVLNIIVSIILLSFAIAAIVLAFNVEHWCYWYKGNNLLYPGTKYPRALAYMGIITALSIYCAIYSYLYDSIKIQHQNDGIKQLRILSIFILITALAGIVSVVLSAVGGFENFATLIATESHDNRIYKEKLFIASTMAIKYALGLIGTVSLMIFPMILIACLNINDKQVKTNLVVAWSILGVVVLAFFITAAVLYKYDLRVNMESETVWAQQKWVKDTILCTVFFIISWVVSVIAGSVSFAKTLQFNAQTN